MGTDGIYRTSDLYVATRLLSNGLQIEGVDPIIPSGGGYTSDTFFLGD